MPVLECFQSTFPINLEEGRVSGQAVLSELQQGQIRVLDCVVHGVEDRPKLCEFVKMRLTQLEAVSPPVGVLKRPPNNIPQTPPPQFIVSHERKGRVEEHSNVHVTSSLKYAITHSYSPQHKRAGPRALEHDAPPARVEGEGDGVLGGGEEGEAGVLHAVGPEAGVLALVGEGDGVEAGARLGLEAVGAQQAAEGEGAPQRQLRRLEGVERLAHPRPCPGRGEVPAPAEERDVEAHAVEGAQEGGGVQEREELLPVFQVLLGGRLHPGEQEGLDTPDPL